MKICTNCKIEFPRTKDYFFIKKIKQQNKSGLAIYYSFKSICKKCHGKKGEENRIKKRCLEMNCNVLEYEKKWKEQYSEIRIKDKKAKLELTSNQYSRFLNSGLKDVNLFKKQIENSKNERNKRLSEMSKASRKYFTYEDKRQALKQYANNERKRLTDSYVANMVFRKPIKELSKEIIETKRLIIKLKRELKTINN